MCAQLTLDSLRPHRLARQAPLSVKFSRQEYWGRLPYPTLGGLPNPGLEPESLGTILYKFAHIYAFFFFFAIFLVLARITFLLAHLFIVYLQL